MPKECLKSWSKRRKYRDSEKKENRGLRSKGRRIKSIS
jgi:hypothetical protein